MDASSVFSEELVCSPRFIHVALTMMSGSVAAGENEQERRRMETL
jgi:hypothetical protein